MGLAQGIFDKYGIFIKFKKFKGLKMEKDKFRLRLKGKTCVFIDWANVYGWGVKSQKALNLQKLYQYLRQYREIADIRFYFGTDVHPKSTIFLHRVKKIGFNLITKGVKYIPVSLESSHFRKILKEVKSSFKLKDYQQTETILKILKQKILRRKCDFDLEIAVDCFKNIEEHESFIFFSGDGDFAVLYRELIARKKQIIVVYASRHIGKEIWEIKKGIFKIKINNLGL